MQNTLGNPAVLRLDKNLGKFSIARLDMQKTLRLRLDMQKDLGNPAFWNEACKKNSRKCSVWGLQTLQEQHGYSKPPRPYEKRSQQKNHFPRLHLHPSKSVLGVAQNLCFFAGYFFCRVRSVPRIVTFHECGCVVHCTVKVYRINYGLRHRLHVQPVSQKNCSGLIAQSFLVQGYGRYAVRLSVCWMGLSEQVIYCWVRQALPQVCDGPSLTQCASICKRHAIEPQQWQQIAISGNLSLDRNSCGMW